MLSAATAPAVLVFAILGAHPTESLEELSPEELRDAAMAAVQRNCSRLTKCRLVWTHRCVDDGFIENREADLQNRHEMWFDGHERIATLFEGSEFVQHENGPVQLRGAVRRAAFRDGEFRRRQTVPDSQMVYVGKEPRFDDDNWLKVIRWGESGRLELWKGGRLKNIEVEASLSQIDGETLLTVTLTNPRVKDFSRFNLSRGGLLQDYRLIDADGRLRSETVYSLEQVDDQLWMPVRLMSRVVEPESGRQTLLHEYTLEMGQFAFNSAAKIPEDAFEIPITTDLIVGDGRGATGVFYTGVTAPVSFSVLAELVELRSMSGSRVFKLTRDGRIPR